MAGPSATVRSLPQFDGSLRTYYQHIQASLGDQIAWVADVIALLDFQVSRSELREIRPDMAHRVDQAVEALRPVLLERATQGMVSVSTMNRSLDFFGSRFKTMKVLGLRC